MSKKMLGLITAVLILSLFAMSSPTHSVYADDPTGKATEKAEGTKEANDSPFCNTTAATQPANAPKQQPRAAKVAAAWDVPYTDVIAWFCKGYGFGQIDLAYAIAKATAGGKTPLTVAQVFAMRDGGQGWGQIVQSAGISMKDVQQLRKDAYKHGPQNKGNGNGKDNGNGKGKGKGKGNGNDSGDDQGND